MRIRIDGRFASPVYADVSATGFATPRVSVVIPVYNMERFVAEAIDSALAQSLPPRDVEVVVVDDGSTDGSRRVIDRYGERVRVVAQRNRGLAAARNAGIHASRGTFLGFLDADDRFHPEKLARQLAIFDRGPDVGIVYTGFRYVDEHGAALPQQGWSKIEGDVLPELLIANRVHPHQPVVRREAVVAAGGFDECLGPAADWDLWIRLSRAGLRWTCVDHPLADYRVRGDAMHQDTAGMHADCLRVLAKVFDDPDLAPHLRRLEPLAYHRRHLVAACEHYRHGDRAAGARSFRAAAELRPEFLVDPNALRDVCRWLLPLGQQGGAPLVAELPRVARALQGALRDLFMAPDLTPAVARLRWRARLTAWRALAPFVRRRARAALRRGWSGRRAAPPTHGA